MDSKYKKIDLSDSDSIDYYYNKLGKGWYKEEDFNERCFVFLPGLMLETETGYGMNFEKISIVYEWTLDGRVVTKERFRQEYKKRTSKLWRTMYE